MTHPDWREPVRLLTRSLRSAATHQLELAAQIGCTLDAELPFNVAAARLVAFLEPKIKGPKHAVAAPTERQMRFLMELCPTFKAGGESRSEISAWIEHHHVLATIAAHKKLRLQSGDVVAGCKARSTDDFADHREPVCVSSIGANGRVYFKGGNGAGAWPTALQRQEGDQLSQPHG